MIRLALAANVADLWLSWGAISVYGIEAEANPVMRAAFGLGLLGGLAMKAALLSIIVAGAALNPRRRTILVGAALLMGMIGATSAWLA